MDGNLSREIYRRLERISDIAREIEQAFERPLGCQDTRGFDHKCREIRTHSEWITEHLEDQDDEAWTRTGSFPVVHDEPSTFPVG
ncbi:MAG: hypothetical protein AAGN46_03985 [Acidobacteriota bacterium]